MLNGLAGQKDAIRREVKRMTGHERRYTLLVEEALEEGRSQPAGIWILGTRFLRMTMPRFWGIKLENRIVLSHSPGSEL